MERAAQRLLPAHAVARHPIGQCFRFANGQTSESLVGRAAGDSQKILPELFLTISMGHEFRSRSVHVSDVALMPAVAAAEVFRRGFENENACTSTPRGDRRAQ